MLDQAAVRRAKDELRILMERSRDGRGGEREEREERGGLERCS